MARIFESTIKNCLILLGIAGVCLGAAHVASLWAMQFQFKAF